MSAIQTYRIYAPKNDQEADIFNEIHILAINYYSKRLKLFKDLIFFYGEKYAVPIGLLSKPSQDYLLSKTYPVKSKNDVVKKNYSNKELTEIILNIDKIKKYFQENIKNLRTNQCGRMANGYGSTGNSPVSQNGRRYGVSGFHFTVLEKVANIR